jgi:8-oxo-dGTP pyrophosphatase MutT (NUDIX family)
VLIVQPSCPLEVSGGPHITQRLTDHVGGGQRYCSRLERIASETVHTGPRVVVRQERWRHADGGEAEREVAEVDDAVTIVAHDGEIVYLVRQPREPVEEDRLLELPAGKLDVDGETPLECAQRELEEEIGHTASAWEELKRFYPAPGFATEAMTLFLATGLEPVEGHEPDPDERIEIVRWPLVRLDDAIAECVDAKSLVGLYALRARLAG